MGSVLTATSALVLAAMVFDEGLWEHPQGIRMYEACHMVMQDVGFDQSLCGEMAIERFRALYPTVQVAWPSCEPEKAERMLWTAIFDRGAVDRLAQSLNALCELK